MVKNLPADAGDTRDIGSIPGREDPLEDGMATHSSILAWRIPMGRGAWWGLTESDMTERLSTHTCHLTKQPQCVKTPWHFQQTHQPSLTWRLTQHQHRAAENRSGSQEKKEKVMQTPLLRFNKKISLDLFLELTVRAIIIKLLFFICKKYNSRNN